MQNKTIRVQKHSTNTKAHSSLGSKKIKQLKCLIPCVPPKMNCSFTLLFEIKKNDLTESSIVPDFLKSTKLSVLNIFGKLSKNDEYFTNTKN